MEPPVIDLRAVRPPKADIQNKENKTCSVCEVTVHMMPEEEEHNFDFFRSCLICARRSLSTARLVDAL